MANSLKDAKITIEYKNNEEAAYKIIDFIINLLLENNLSVGESSDSGKDYRRDDKL